jgi:hypothetical protein
VADPDFHIAQRHDPARRGGVAAEALVEIVRGPDIVIAAHEVELNAGLLHLIQAVQDLLEAFEAEVGVIEPEVEYVPEQEEMIDLAGHLQEFEERVDAAAFGAIGPQSEMRIGDE